MQILQRNVTGTVEAAHNTCVVWVSTIVYIVARTDTQQTRMIRKDKISFIDLRKCVVYIYMHCVIMSVIKEEEKIIIKNVR